MSKSSQHVYGTNVAGRPRVPIPDAVLIPLIEQHGIRGAAVLCGFNEDNVRQRLKRWRSQGRDVEPGSQHIINRALRETASIPGRQPASVDDGVVIVASDPHYWPGPPSLMHRALVSACREYKPKLFIMNGDVCDFQQVSRHPPIGWQQLPTVQQEIEAAQERLHEIELALGKCRKLWPLGNHDMRFSTFLARQAKEFAEVHGVSLKDHFPNWEPCWSVQINRDVVVKHRFKGGIYAARNNTLHSGWNIIVGHRHSAQVVPFTDYNGTRWGVDTGCIADANHQCFVDYTEDSPKDWREGFCILQFKDGRLMPPELVLKWDDDSVIFRGQVIHV